MHLCFIFYISILLYLLWCLLKNKPNKSSNDLLTVHKCYLDIIPEAYNKQPNLDKILKCISSLKESSSKDVFVILDSIRIYAKSIRMTNITKELKYTDGDIGMYYYQMEQYSNLIKKYDISSKVKSICEIGFQVGVGAITLLASLTNKINYYGFDYGNEYSKISYAVVSKYFNMKMIWGKSEITVPQFYKNYSLLEKCDVIHIDGCHNQDNIINDIINMKKISNSNSLLLLDDVYTDSPAVLKAITNKLIKNVKCHKWKPYCSARY